MERYENEHLRDLKDYIVIVRIKFNAPERELKLEYICMQKNHLTQEI